MFVIPMAGESRRFRDAGYLLPKFRLAAHGASLFEHAVNSFSTYFRTDEFLFVVRGADTARFVQRWCEELMIERVAVVTLDGMTAGQAETVLRGLDDAGVDDSKGIAVFNIDTFRPAYRKPQHVADPNCTGYLEVFRGSGTGWSFVAPHPVHGEEVAEVVEKDRISDLCCTGLYYFRRAGDFRWAYHNPEPPRSDAERRERYVAPLYNALISSGRRIGLQLIDSADVIFCGTPQEYAHVLASEETGRRIRMTRRE
ncbi:MAG: hypothetical protein JWM91_1093 [Rhodospirillales bacterium]|nr:hypothetical protein [Rhodospirillales bacterium]